MGFWHLVFGVFGGGIAEVVIDGPFRFVDVEFNSGGVIGTEMTFSGVVDSQVSKPGFIDSEFTA